MEADEDFKNCLEDFGDFTRSIQQDVRRGYINYRFNPNECSSNLNGGAQGYDNLAFVEGDRNRQESGDLGIVNHGYVSSEGGSDLAIEGELDLVSSDGTNESKFC